MICRSHKDVILIPLYINYAVHSRYCSVFLRYKCRSCKVVLKLHSNLSEWHIILRKQYVILRKDMLSYRRTCYLTEWHIILRERFVILQNNILSCGNDMLSYRMTLSWGNDLLSYRTTYYLEGTICYLTEWHIILWERYVILQNDILSWGNDLLSFRTTYYLEGTICYLTEWHIILREQHSSLWFTNCIIHHCWM